ncbi:MAG: TIGR01210 family radical SAM protein, partial [Methanomicrobia archaeon]|nr:TIGR01210 family radical SAM protein [Methanomicrobia archaeon]
MSWVTEEIVNGKKVRALNIVLPTKGCSYNKCYMCSYSLDIIPQENLLEIVKNEVEKRDVKKVKIFTS